MDLRKEEKIKNKLLINEDEIWEETLELASKIISITNAGDIILKVNDSKITLKDKILLFFIGRRYAFEAEIVDDSYITLDELSRQLHTERKIVSARISELIRESKVKARERGTYQLAYFDLKKFLEGLLTKYS